ncbi:TlpA disulfide reductase family protein [uncultured Pedobacter sp.]|uniref:TlpA family protein disulfide reductase n=1 Tax=uncultured Pedobacter sp. TaxID=246139 RepID=UPI0025E7193E|nr:TlpA disulfide reductase family protein [uncultured Pedobacter sp.]
MILWTSKVLMIIGCALFFLSPGEVGAQLLQKSSQSINAKKNLSYTDIVQTKFSFQEDFYADTLRSAVSPGNPETISEGKFLLTGKNISYAFDGNRLITLHPTDSTYAVQKESVSGQDTRTLLYWAQEMQKLSELSENKIVKLADTLINGISFANICITVTDTVEQNQRSYNISNFIVDKENYLPVKITRKFKGLGNDGTSFGLIEIHNYTDYKINQKKFPDLSIATIPSHFSLPVKKQPVKFLENGVPAPFLKAYDKKGNPLDTSVLKGKMVLINFSLIGCPHCVGAAQMLNRLQEKFKGRNLLILNIYPIDPIETILKFDVKETVLSPSYTSDRSVVKSFPLDGYPSFYLIDMQGKVAQSYNGYYKSLEHELEEKIETYLSK